MADGALQLVAGKLVGASRDGDGFAATIRRRGATATETFDVARIYDCTGISSDLAAGSNPIVRSLIDRGLARPDPLRIGLDVSEACAIVKGDGQPSERLYAIGPLTRGTFFEINAIPDIRLQCATLARSLTARAGLVAQAG